MHKHFLFFCLFVPIYLFSQVQEIPLPANWTFHQLHQAIWLPAEVPGYFHTDLLRNKKIDDPFFRDNEKKLQALEHQIVEYEGTFSITSYQLSAKNIQLIFEGLDTYSEVKINGVAILRSNNMFRTYTLEVKKWLQEGENTLLIRFYPAADSGKILAKKNPILLPEKERIYTRKAQYQYGWDWAPRFVSCGIWRPIRLKCNWASEIKDIQLVQNSLSQTLAEMTAKMTLFSDTNAVKTIEISDLNHDFLIKKEFSLHKGENEILFPFSVTNPQLWYPNGYGDAILYSFCIKVLKDRHVEDLKTLTWGFRTIEVVQEKDSIGKSFYLKVNNIPIFMKGANWVPAESFPSHVSYNMNDKNTDIPNIPRLIQAAKSANFNMLRIWGGGYYEDDRFYHLCDANGILIWQDFMFACAMYPGDSLFLQNIENEAIDNVKRLRHHPCIALWCGNNEIDEAWHNWGWQKAFSYSAQDSQAIWQDYQHVFHEMIPAVLAKYDNNRYYHPSSPANGWGRQKAYNEGDVHYWGVWWGLEDYRKYTEKVGRFNSEYGMQAMPDYTTIQRFAEKKDQKLFSEALKSHQKHPTGFANLATYLQRDYPKTKNLFHYTYLTQLLQAEAMQTAIQAHRLAKPYCMGTLYWQLNDCWSGISWSSIDYYGNWKASHYAIKAAFEPIIPIITEQDNNIIVNIVSDKIEDTPIYYTIDIQDFEGTKILTQTKTNFSKIIYFNQNITITNVSIPRDIDKTKCFVHVTFFYTNNGETKTNETFYYFVAPKDLMLNPKPNIEMNLDKENPHLLHISANTFIKNLYIYQENTPLHVSENYFDLPANTVKTVELSQVPRDLKAIKFLYLNGL